MPLSRERAQLLMWRWLPSAVLVFVLVLKLRAYYSGWDVIRPVALMIGVAAIMSWVNDTPSTRQLNIEYTGYLAVVGAAVVAAVMGPTVVVHVAGFSLLVAAQLWGLRRAKSVLA